MTAEYRQTLVAQAKDAAERAKGRVRDQRNKAVKQFRAVKTGVSEDDIRRLETEVRGAARAPRNAADHPLHRTTSSRPRPARRLTRS